ncbi:FAD-binding oxidoreductase [Variovorax paradoxus]|nr:FAD-dependent oxidoreductase [Variovorax paradoxus]MBT2302459.1 FAD-binding oxidoreductase [Variovorax paradoxus]
MTTLFPELEGLAIDFQWSGLVGMTLNQLPRVGRIDERTCVCFGYNGVGIAMATLLGRYAGSLMAGESPQLALLDASRQKPVPFPFAAHSRCADGCRLVPDARCARAMTGRSLLVVTRTAAAPSAPTQPKWIPFQSKRPSAFLTALVLSHLDRC